MNSNKFIDKDKIRNNFATLALKLDKQRHISSIKEGFMLAIPATIIGGIFLILAQPPVDPSRIAPTNIFFQFLLAWKAWAVKNTAILMLPYNLTMGLLGIYAVIGISYSLAKKCQLDPINSAISSLIVFLVVSVTYKDGNIVTTNLGSVGIFSAIIIGLLTTEIAKFLKDKNVMIRLPEQVPPMVAAPFELLIPLGVNVALFMSINGLLSLGGTSIPNLVATIIRPLLVASGSLWMILFFTFLARFLWFFGIHGDSVVNSVLTPIVMANLTQNAAAIAAGQKPSAIFAGYFINIFGAWCMLPALVLALLIFSKSVHLKTLVKLALIPDIFNINEPSTFGIPIVANMNLVVPYILIPMVNVSIAYFATLAGLIGKFYIQSPFTTPAIIGAFLGTMDWKASVLYALLFVLDFLIWIPFIKNYDNILLERESNNAVSNKTIDIVSE
ncbi:PTS lactose transporter subunit IIC [Thermoanaerobacterium thermosaccharolyticum]|uniref:Permease IIC component n=1 Tax=Thermoanaerobacterium thermosaccharolyticum TaxID=1517 RepID=A0A223HXA9_THETR|nr:PTS transporter subunit EIIC [Thermoanaerobacterium thermosaccharolyticum]AST57111.1 PTS lactose transporter subunit IIC [Thermoanaerobacterium thermosaccharolyticum]